MPRGRRGRGRWKRTSLSRPKPTDDDALAEDRSSDIDADADVDADGDADADADADGEGESMVEATGEAKAAQSALYSRIETMAKFLCEQKDDETEETYASPFQRVPNKRLYPDYHQVIKNPIAFSTIRQKLIRKGYKTYKEFVDDVALICHNARVYNRSSSLIFQYAVKIQEIFEAELKKLVDAGTITAEEGTLPDLGELPEESPSPPPGEDDEDGEEEEEDEDDEDEEEEGSDDEDSKPKRGRRGRPRSSIKAEKAEEEGAEDEKLRGRPPKVLTPMEMRIHAVLKGLRKPKGPDGTLLILAFERLPDKSEFKDYYTVIKDPVSLDTLKKRAKRKKYANVDALLRDIETMFENAKTYNEPGSALYKAAVELQAYARTLAAEEKAKPDDALVDDDGKIPLQQIEHAGQIWKVGDWVHIRNLNDLTKPLVAQIYRTWKDGESGQAWLNACWFFRPEQTVHRFDKHFYENEVVKTGRYKDHRIEEVVDRCFVMFHTRYFKGRPRGFPPDKKVYVCEARYNELKHSFNKIKTWASCLPDEVRDRDYEMELFDVARKPRKFPSPIKHLLPEDAKETDELPRPTAGSQNAPPVVGAVHKRPREPNESPPPSPTPSPKPAPIAMAAHTDPTRRSAVPSIAAAPAQAYHPGVVNISQTPGGPPQAFSQWQAQQRPAVPTAMVGAQPQMHIAPAPNQSAAPMPQTPHFVPQHQPPQGYAPQFTPKPAPQAHLAHIPPHAQTPSHLPGAAPYDPSRLAAASAVHQRMPPQPPPANIPPGTGVHAPAYHPQYHHPRPIEVFTLPTAVDRTIPDEARRAVHTDARGRVIFYASPPDTTPHQSPSLSHSIRYLADRSRVLAERQRKRKERDDAAATAAAGGKSGDDAQARKRVHSEEPEVDHGSKTATTTAAAAAGEVLAAWVGRMDRETRELEEAMGGWREEMRKDRITKDEGGEALAVHVQ